MCRSNETFPESVIAPYTTMVIYGISFGGMHPLLGEWQSSYRQCRKDEVVLCRARIGHTQLTHSYILKKDPPPQCERCQCILIVCHILVECNHLTQTRNDIFGKCCVVESFKFHPELILNFLRDSEFYSKL